jgi:hypothetical protein
MKVLNILATGYRATLEEQDDTVAWISQAMRRAGADIDLLLRASAANYVVEGQSVEPMAIGGRAQRHAPDLPGQIADLASSGAAIFVLAEDLEAYGISGAPRLEQARIVAAEELPDLLSGYDAVWHW